MKQCPNCTKKYGDELFFCLDDGSPLQPTEHTVDPNAPTVADLSVMPSLRTEVLPSRPAPESVVIATPQGANQPKRSKVPYAIIGILTLICFGLGASLLVVNLDRFARQSNSTANIPRNEIISTTPGPAPLKAGTPVRKSAQVEDNTVAIEPIRPTPIGLWSGTWNTDSGTLFNFELRLLGLADNRVTGFIKWTMRRTARQDKQSKVGLSATEWVEGKFDQSDGTIQLKGQRKDDPDDVLVMLDDYKLKLSPDNKKLAGLARNGGKWNGKVSLSRRE